MAAYFIGMQRIVSLASRRKRVAVGYGTAAAHYGLTTQPRNVIVLVTPVHVRARQVGESRVRIVNPTPKKCFGFASVDVLGHNVMISDREKNSHRLPRPPGAGRRSGRGRHHRGHRQPPVRVE